MRWWCVAVLFAVAAPAVRSLGSLLQSSTSLDLSTETGGKSFAARKAGMKWDSGTCCSSKPAPKELRDRLNANQYSSLPAISNVHGPCLPYAKCVENFGKDGARPCSNHGTWCRQGQLCVWGWSSNMCVDLIRASTREELDARDKREKKEKAKSDHTLKKPPVLKAEPDPAAKFRKTCKDKSDQLMREREAKKEQSKKKIEDLEKQIVLRTAAAKSARIDKDNFDTVNNFAKAATIIAETAPMGAGAVAAVSKGGSLVAQIKADAKASEAEEHRREEVNARLDMSEEHAKANHAELIGQIHARGQKTDENQITKDAKRIAQECVHINEKIAEINGHTFKYPIVAMDIGGANGDKSIIELTKLVTVAFIACQDATNMLIDLQENSCFKYKGTIDVSMLSTIMVDVESAFQDTEHAKRLLEKLESDSIAEMRSPKTPINCSDLNFTKTCDGKEPDDCPNYCTDRTNIFRTHAAKYRCQWNGKRCSSGADEFWAKGKTFTEQVCRGQRSYSSCHGSRS